MISPHDLDEAERIVAAEAEQEEEQRHVQPPQETPLAVSQSVTMARMLRRIDNLEFAAIRAVNMLQNNMANEAHETLITAIRERWQQE